ncbi:MAG: lamin tail domain-containing protein [Verrucomicrobiales bacterium]|nr:lamin tail domain-containing protein [Verrucomicrobiales bacterium]
MTEPAGSRRPGRRIGGATVLSGLGMLLAAGLVPDVRAEILAPLQGDWRYLKGTREASTPVEAWRLVGFDDSGWSTGNAPFHYGEAGIEGGTVLDDMRNNYTTLYLRRVFELDDTAAIAGLTLRAAVDDGLIAWVNGREIARYRVDAGEPAFNGLANSNAPEPVEFASYTVANEPGWLVEGANVLALQVFNVSRTSSDLQLHAELSSAAADSNPPTIIAVSPLPGVTGTLTAVTVRFNEAVTGIEPEDLRINGIPAERLVASGSNYTFGFPQPAFGIVRITWDPAHGITDFGTPPNPFDAGAPNASWTYTLTDGAAPQLGRIEPPPGRVVRSLTEIELRFSEPVTGVDGADLEFNGLPGASATGILTGPYRILAPALAAGTVTVDWAAAHGIADFGEPPNPFHGTSWSYTIDPAAVVPDVVISEFLAGNLSGTKDEDGEPQDWIELFNRGQTAADLTGWSLSDDPDAPGKWVLPGILLGAGQRLVVFASGKDRIAAGGELHTNFKLGLDGEYLGLFNHEQPRQALSEFAPRYPEQRNDHSYGLDGAGAWRYFAPPTPGRANGSSTILGLTPKVTFSVKRGFATEAFDLTLDCELPEASIRFTTDGSEPTSSSGRLYEQPIRIDRTQVVRAAAFAPDRLPSKVKTHTYLFVDDLVRQPSLPSGFPAQWGSSVITTGDYAMDPRIVQSPVYADRVREGLASLPAVSLAMPVADWFSPDRGIYSNGQREGIAWERAGSFELFTPDGREDLQEDCGLRIQGGSSTGPWKSYKLSMRTNFRSDYGVAWLDHPLFADSPVERFDILIIDAGLNYVWSYGGGSGPSEQRTKAKYLTDQYASDLQLACGDLAVHGRYVNVFVNGLYWGLHNLHEEPEAAFGSTYIGGDKEDYDVIKHTGNNVLDGNAAAWNEMMQTARAGLADPANYAALAALLDIPAFIDYMLVHFYIGNTDWPHHNWYALRRRAPGALWCFCKLGFGALPQESVGEDRTGVNNANTCAELYSLLRQNAEFRLLFADRAHRHFFNGGPYYVNPAAPAWDPAHPENNRPAALYNQRVAEIDTALVAESARWGDNQRPDEPYTRDGEYEETLRWLNETYFPQRSATVLGQLRQAGLFPTVTAPGIVPFGGRVPAGTRPILNAPGGVIYFTTDGADPRQAGTGAVAPSAEQHRGLFPPLTTDTLLKARVLSAGNWSALVEAAFQVGGDDRPLVPSEIMYNASGGGEYEFLEMVNLGSWPVDLSAHTFDGLEFVFPPGSTVAPGQVVLLASGDDPAAFAARYPGVTPDAYYAGSLSNGGETLNLKDSQGQIVWQVAYRDDGAWAAAADGDGFSLELAKPEGDLSEPATWRESAQPGGSPGAWTPPAARGTVRLSEILALAIDPADADFVELHNAGPDDVDLAGWTLRDEGNAGAFRFPANTVLPAGGFLVVWCDGRTNGAGWHAPFALDRDADSVVLRDAGERTVDAVSYGHQMAGFSLGRSPETWKPCAPTPGAGNTAAPLALSGTLVINEWFSNPLPGEDDWLEILNPGPLPVSLAGLGIVTDNTTATVRSLALLEPLGFAVLVADDRNGPGHLTLKLPAAGGRLGLLTAEGDRGDTVTYTQQPENVALGRLPDGAGLPRALGAITPGRPNSDDPGDSDRDRDGLPDAWEAAHALDPGSARGDDGPDGDPDRDGLPNHREFEMGTDPQVADAPLRLTIHRTPEGLTELIFQAATDLRYRIETRASLLGGEWEVWREYGIGSVTGEVRATLPATAADTTRFYRLSAGVSPHY